MKNFKWNNSKVIALTTTKDLGNMAYQVASNKEEVLLNRKILANELNQKIDNIILTHQSHSDIIREVTKENLGQGSTSFESGVNADALYTRDNNLTIGIFHADCVPVFLYHPDGLVAIIHAGYQGTLKHITYKSIKYLIENENIDPRDIKIRIGPARQCLSFEINEENCKEIENAKCELCILEKDGKKYFDAPLSNIYDAIRAGVLIENIDNSLIDTVTDENCFSAYKKTPIGRMVSLIKIK